LGHLSLFRGKTVFWGDGLDCSPIAAANTRGRMYTSCRCGFGMYLDCFILSRASVWGAEAILDERKGRNSERESD
jgi:hypothetical protein